MARTLFLTAFVVAFTLGSPSSPIAAQSPSYASYAGTITSVVTHTHSHGFIVLLEVTGSAAHQIRMRDAAIGNWTCEGTSSVTCRTAYLRSDGRHLRPGEIPLGLVVAGPYTYSSRESGHPAALMHTFTGHDEWYFRVPLSAYLPLTIPSEHDLHESYGYRVWRGPDEVLCPGHGGPLEGTNPAGYHAQFGITHAVMPGDQAWEYDEFFLVLTGCRDEPG